MASFGVRVDSKKSPDDLELRGARYGFGVSWDSLEAGKVDIDLQCVVVDNAGTIIDCAYYDNLKAVRAITHSGDEAHGKPDNIEEMVWANLRKMPSNVSLLVFVVAAYSGGSLMDVANGKLHVMEEKENNEIAVFEMERSAGSADVVAAMVRDERLGWRMQIIDLPAEGGQHFMDILPLLSQVIRGYIPGAPARQKVAFAMEKGSVLDLPMDLGRITIGLGWDSDCGECDLDASAVLMGSDGKAVEAVFFGRLESIEHGIQHTGDIEHGIQHTGDNLTGEGEGDDEQILVDLKRIGGKILQVVFCVNIYTQRKTFAQVSNPFCRVVDSSSGAELCRYALRDAGSDNGLIIARIAREAGGRWGFHALGLPSRGSMYKDSLPQIRQACQLKTATLVERSQSRSTLGDDLKAPGSWAVLRQPRPTWRRSLVKAALHLIGCSGKVAPETPKSRLTK